MKAMLLSAVFLLVACAGCSKATESGTAGGANKWTVPGVVRITINTDVNSFDPIIAQLYAENYVQEAIFSGLVKYDGSENLVPDLATEVPTLENGGISEDGRSVTYHLRKNAVWQDGVPVTAADVQFTYTLIMNPKDNSPVESTYARIERIDAPDPHTVILRLREPFAPVLSQVFCVGGFGQIVPKHVLAHTTDLNRDPFNTHPVGSGAFVLARWDRGSTMVLKANPRYFGGPPHVREIDIQVMPNEDTQLVSMQSHQLDVATQARPSQVEAYKRIDGTHVVVAPTYVEDFITLNLTRSPFDDVRVRRALAMAFDRDRVASTAFNGTAIPATSIIPPHNWAFEPDNDAPTFDPVGARRLLDEAGWVVGSDGVREKDGKRLSFTLLHTPSTTSAAITEELQSAWHDVGADVQLRAVPRNVLIGQIEPAGSFDALLAGYGYDVDPDRSQLVETRFIEPHGFNSARYSSADVDRWTEAANATYDRATRKKYYSLIQRRLNEDLPYIPIDWEEFVYGVNDDLRGFRPETVNSDFWNVQDWSI